MKKSILFFLLAVLALGANAQTIIYVDSAAAGSTHDGTTWSTAYTQLSDAFTQFNAASTSTQYEVHIAKGTYYPAVNNRNSAFGIFRGGIKLLGSYQAGTGIRDTALYTTVLSGDIGVQGNNGDNSYHVMVLAGIPAIADSIVIDGLRIAKGNANGFSSFIYNGVNILQNKGAAIYSKNAHPIITNCSFLSNRAADVSAVIVGGGGGAIFNAGSNPTIAYCTFSGNTTASAYGGAIFDSSSNPTIINCIFSANSSDFGGVLFNINSNPTITNCTFSGNTTSNNGGAMYNSFSSPTISNCSFSGNIAASNGDGGAIINNNNSYPVITSCSFTGNVSGHGGGAISDRYSASIITGCSFLNNTSGLGGAIYTYYADVTITNCSFSGNTASSSGGAISNNGSDPVITNCRLLNNSANVVGGGMDNDFSSPTITNCTFAGNAVTQSGSAYGGGMHNNFSNPIIVNTTFSANTSTYYGGGMYNEFSSPRIKNTTFFNNTPNALEGTPGDVFLQNSIVWDTIVNTNYTAFNSIIKGQAPYAAVTAGQLFKNTANLAGADGIWNTADDGLQLLPCAPAVNAGNNDSVPAGIITDITGAPRIQFAVVDMGAYESNSLWTPVIANITGYGISTNANVITGSTTYFTLLCDTLLAAVRSGTDSNAIEGNAHAKVWVDSSAGSAFVVRHYQITPYNNANNATGIVTLYFLQAEFDAYNALNTIKLPANPADTAGIANLQILKINGLSNDNSGLPASYTGTQTTLNPEDSNIVWNSTANRWEVSFAVTGFGGFFVQTTSGIPLGIQLKRFAGYRAQQANYLKWTLSDEQPMVQYELQRSADAKEFVPIATIRNTYKGQYSYTDTDPYYEGVRYYRLHLIEHQNSSYSNTIALAATNENGGFGLFPNPTGREVTIFTGNPDLLPGKATVYDAAGRVIMSFALTENKQLLDVSNLTNGLYLIYISNGAILRFMKQ